MRRNALWMVSLLFSLLCGTVAQGREVIEHFQGDLQIAVDGSMQVIETITVIAEGKSIKRGIYRDFPTTYRDRFNHRVQVRFDVLRVRRDGVDEPWFTQPMSNGERLYIGDRERFVASGRHIYEITYRTDRQLGFFADHDELYWNVTGNGWAFPILQAIAYVYLPKSVPASSIVTEAYTGRSGAQGGDYDAGVDAEGVAWFRSTRELAPQEGLTLVASWPKGHVHAPTTRDRLRWLLQDNGRLMAGALGAALLLVYYLMLWMRVGRDPQAGVIVTHYDPPQGYSPASMRYVQRMGYDAKTFTAALVNLAANGHVRIEHEGGEFAVVRAQSDAAMAPGEKALLDRLLGKRQRQAIERSSHVTISHAMDAHKARLEADYEKKYFATNYLITGIGFGISLLVLLATLFWPGADSRAAGDSAAAVFMTVWLSGWSFGVFALLGKTLAHWRDARRSGRYVSAIFLSLFSLPFIGGWVMGAFMLSEVASLSLVLLIAFLIALNFTFYHLMKAPTVLGRQMLDRIEGFREYLTLAEADELRVRNPPARTPELFERLLPYAIALDVEDVWGQRFEAVLQAARVERDYHGPRWYSGRESFTARSLASNVGSALAGSISASSRAPGSSSGSSGGSSGGGSSGGGGGGGGGGGW